MNKNLTERLEAGDWRLEAERRAQSAESAFTLVELLIVITIIGILASMSIVVTQQVYFAAKQAKTQVTIAKIDQLILEIYEKYESRRPQVYFFDGNNNQISAPADALVRQAAILWAKRDLMRMEMPGNWDEVRNKNSSDVRFRPATLQFKSKNSPLPKNKNNILSLRAMCEDSLLNRLYYTASQKANGNYGSAKCLYLIIAYTNPEAREKFNDNEIATDDDGLSYFIDGWGNPIYFLRWAPGLVDSDRQPVIRDSTKTQAFWKEGDQTDSNPNSWYSAAFNDAKNSAAEQMPDPWDPTEIGGIIDIGNSQPANNIWTIDLDAVWTTNSAYKSNHVRGWMLIPLIVSSAGNKDGKSEDFGKNFGLTLTPPGYASGSIPVIDPFYWPLGELCIDKSDPNYKDFNFSAISNHSVRR
ncbi:MAG: type II secretion system GspH family protein [Planctomycetaceae bacterium]|nr:type II secretion system GspH family protein [Planctomycetaceae bacterium]